MDGAENGNKGANRKTSQLVLTLDHASFVCSIAGDIENFDAAISMCDIARRYFEGKLRAAQAAGDIHLATPDIALFRNQRH